MTRSFLFRGALSLGVLVSACGGAISDPAAETAGSSNETGGTGGGSSATGGAETGTGGGTPATGGGVSTGGAATGGAGGVPSGGTAGAPCVPRDIVYYPDTCADLSRLRVADPSIVDDGGDGIVSPGEGFTVEVWLEDVSGYGYFMYPYVAFMGQSGLFVGDPQYFYAVPQCDAMPASTHVDVSPYLNPGMTLYLTAQVAALNTECPDAPSISIAVVLGQRQ
jgi:hypothetical protein